MLHHNAECRPAMSHFTYCHAEGNDVDCRYDDSPYAECRCAECLFAECRYDDSHYAECHYAECRFAERYGTDFFIKEFDLYISSLKQHR